MQIRIHSPASVSLPFCLILQTPSLRVSDILSYISVSIPTTVSDLLSHRSIFIPQCLWISVSFFSLYPSPCPCCLPEFPRPSTRSMFHHGTQPSILCPIFPWRLCRSIVGLPITFIFAKINHHVNFAESLILYLYQIFSEAIIDICAKFRKKPFSDPNSSLYPLYVYVPAVPSWNTNIWRRVSMSASERVKAW